MTRIWLQMVLFAEVAPGWVKVRFICLMNLLILLSNVC
uniref:Uncharacterized protein n=1 Tax=Siphoviridae sp. ctoNj20 TaxID=2826085 RepID=A0A8D9UHE5_9CAUD|nr:MAG TPA: hypothetical protein [Siphoviridae sp. ctoNj20]